MRIYLLRHGDALALAADDASRPLSPVGEEQARRVGKYLSSAGIAPAKILASPLLRAEQTAAFVAEALQQGPVEPCEHLVPSSDPRNLLNFLNALGVPSVLCVGHEPHLSTTISVLISGSRSARVEMAKAALAAIEAEEPLSPGCGRLQWIVPPGRVG